LAIGEDDDLERSGWIDHREVQDSSSIIITERVEREAHSVWTVDTDEDAPTQHRLPQPRAGSTVELNCRDRTTNAIAIGGVSSRCPLD
jgi:hypothetical protein